MAWVFYVSLEAVGFGVGVIFVVYGLSTHKHIYLRSKFAEAILIFQCLM